ncbi:OmpA family protein, partial [Pararhodospirillum oryzae]|uniref:OmpA family protein n=1 Tax=Pararhodospirillum oryzae TaxID=478448 RepID=UPI0011BF53B0
PPSAARPPAPPEEQAPRLAPLAATQPAPARPPVATTRTETPRLSTGGVPVQTARDDGANTPVGEAPPVEGRALSRPTPDAPARGASLSAPIPPPTPSRASAPPSSDQVATRAQPAPVPRGVSLSFATGSADLPPDAGERLDRLAAQALADPGRRITVMAYATAEGSGGLNRAKRLSLTRALTVRAYLMNKGVRSPSIEVRALGDQGGPNRDRVDLDIDSH